MIQKEQKNQRKKTRKKIKNKKKKKKKTQKKKKIGYGEEESEKIKEFEQGDKIILGFGCQANKQYGVCSIYCYYLGKRKFGIIQNSGLLQLRSKLKKNPEFKAELETKKSSLTEQQKLILDTCDLPDAAFFPFASYIMTY